MALILMCSHFYVSLTLRVLVYFCCLARLAVDVYARGSSSHLPGAEVSLVCPPPDLRWLAKSRQRKRRRSSARPTMMPRRPQAKSMGMTWCSRALPTTEMQPRTWIRSYTDVVSEVRRA